MRTSAPTPSLPVTPRGRGTRTKLLAAAEVVLGEKGVERASIAEITERAGVALGTFYLYFPHKQAVLIELVDELGTRLRRSLSKAVAGLTDRLEIERAGFREFFRFAHEHHRLHRIVRQCEFVDPEVYHRYYERLAKRYAQGLQAAMDAGQIRRLEAEPLAYSLMGVADFIAMWVLWRDDADLPKVLEQVMAFVERGMSATSAPKGRGGTKAKRKAAPQKRSRR